MKRVVAVFCLMVLPSVAYAQYWGERVSEQSFESSSLHFRSHFLNTYGLNRFSEVAVGLIDDPFLNLHLNPANLPRIRKGSSLFYLDFRGDRTEPAVINQYYRVIDPYYPVAPDPRLYRTTRTEPEPLLSLGLLSYPFHGELRKVFIGGTYQIIYDEDPYYSNPFWIYGGQFGYDSFGREIAGPEDQLPEQERYFGQDQLTTEVHLYSAFLGFPVSREVDFGVGINGVSHSRDGSFVRRFADEYGTTDEHSYRSRTERAKDQEYDHFDINAGIRAEISNTTTFGFKAGFLDGDAQQSELRRDSSLYLYNDTLTDDSWSRGYSDNATDNTWDHDGESWYGRVNIEYDGGGDHTVRAYYRHAKTDVDLRSSGMISDTSAYRSHYIYTYDNITRTNDHWSNSRVIDSRTGTGTREETADQAMLSVDWKLDSRSDVQIGIFGSQSETEIRTTEPVSADRWSEWHSRYVDTGMTSYDSQYRLQEDKTLYWRSNTDYWTVQIPVVLRHTFDDHFAMVLGVNRIIERWSITEKTVADFDLRRTTDENGTEQETDFRETYTEGERKFTEDYTAVLASLEVAVSRKFKVRLMVEPETEGDFEISQWWLSFAVGL